MDNAELSQVKSNTQYELHASLLRLHAAMRGAAEAQVPLASTCYRPDLLNTVDELTQHFEQQKRKAEQYASIPAIAAAWRVPPRR